MQKKGFITVVFFIVFVGLSLLCLYIINPYLQALLAAGVLAYIFHPVYKWLVVRTKLPSLSALLVSALIIIILVLPVALAIDAAANEARFAYVRTLQIIQTGKLIDGQCLPAESGVCVFFDQAGQFISSPQVQIYAKDAVSKATTFIITKVSGILLALPFILINILITFFATYYLLKDGPALVHRFKRLLPVTKVHQNHIVEILGEVTHSLVFGSLLIALLQGILAALGFWVVGITSPLLWGGVTAIFALVPFLGTGIVWAPAAIYMILIGVSQGDPATTWRGIGLFIYGAAIISTIDNFLKPRIIGERTGIHPVWVLVGVLGGLTTFGIMGFVIGPLVIAMFKSIVTIYEQELDT